MRSSPVTVRTILPVRASAARENGPAKPTTASETRQLMRTQRRNSLFKRTIPAKPYNARRVKGMLLWRALHPKEGWELC